MFKLSVRNLLAHKIRFVMTSFAVVLGVSFVVGSLVVTDTVRQSFDTLFAEINQGIDLEVRSQSAFPDGPGEGDREPVPADLVDVIAGVEGVEAVQGTVSGTAQPIAPDGEPVKTTGAPLVGTSWGDGSPAVVRDAVVGPPSRAPARSPSTRTRSTTTASRWDSPSTCCSRTARRPSRWWARRRSATSNSLAGARLTLFDPIEAQRVFDRGGLWDAIDIVVVRGRRRGSPSEPTCRTPWTRSSPRAPRWSPARPSPRREPTPSASSPPSSATSCSASPPSPCSSRRSTSTTRSRSSSASASRSSPCCERSAAHAAQIRGTVILEAFLVGLFSSVIGIGVGMLTAFGIRGLLNAGGFGLPADALVLRAPTVIAALVIGIGVTVAASVLPARKSAKVSPIEGMRAMTTAGGSRRTRLAVGAVMGGIGALLLGFGLFAADGPATAAARPRRRGRPRVPRHHQPQPAVRRSGRPRAWAHRWPSCSACRASSPGRTRPATRIRTASTASALVIGLALVTMALVVGTSVKETFASAIERSVDADFVISEPSFNGFSRTLADAAGGQRRRSPPWRASGVARSASRATSADVTAVGAGRRRARRHRRGGGQGGHRSRTGRDHGLRGPGERPRTRRRATSSTWSSAGPARRRSPSPASTATPRSPGTT